MTPILSRYAQLRANANRYYNALIFPCIAEVFDQQNPRPRIALNIELDRINEKERKEGRTW